MIIFFFIFTNRSRINSFKNKSGKIINTKRNESYFHIYFDEGKKEIKANYFTEDNKTLKIKIIIDYQVKSFEGFFDDSKYIESINFKKFK